MQSKELVIHLLKEELRNKRLLYSLEDIGFDCSFYYLNVSHIILELAGFKQKTEELCEWYVDIVDKAVEEINFRNMEEMLKIWPVVLYNELIKKKCISK